MIVSKCFAILSLAIYCCNAQFLRVGRVKKHAKPPGMKLKERLQEKLYQYKARQVETICYATVGCFELPHKRSPLQKIPESPDALNTKFYLFTRRTKFDEPEVLEYDDDGKSLAASKFNVKLPVKLIIHGYMGQWSDPGFITGADSYLKIYDCNVILMDWSRGARGNQYAVAAANTEVVGRQLGLILLKIIELGVKPDNIHVLGFSLGAHVAGAASEVLKKRGHLLGRITGLDAASPLFRTNILKEQHKKLDQGDARFVDVIHTDSSPSVTDGFGLWKPIGHVDFFPNGGQEQPGCTDTQQSIVASQFETLTLDGACSHIRAWRLFEETLLMKAKHVRNPCQFTAFKCTGGLKSFEKGYCFPQFHKNASLLPDFQIGQLGEDAKGEGIMFFVTKPTAPFCGIQMQASVQINPKTPSIKGLLFLNVIYPGHSIQFPIYCDATDSILAGTTMNGLGVAAYGTLHDVKTLNATMKFFEKDRDNTTPMIYIDQIAIQDMYGNSWHSCRRGAQTGYKIILSKETCV